jgi:hypothetical protein
MQTAKFKQGDLALHYASKNLWQIASKRIWIEHTILHAGGQWAYKAKQIVNGKPYGPHRYIYEDHLSIYTRGLTQEDLTQLRKDQRDATERSQIKSRPPLGTIAQLALKKQRKP